MNFQVVYNLEEDTAAFKVPSSDVRYVIDTLKMRMNNKASSINVVDLEKSRSETVDTTPSNGSHKNHYGLNIRRHGNKTVITLKYLAEFPDSTIPQIRAGLGIRSAKGCWIGSIIDNLRKTGRVTRRACSVTKDWAYSAA